MEAVTFVLPEIGSSATTQAAPTTPKTATGNIGRGGSLPPVIVVLTPFAPEPERQPKRPALADIALTLNSEFSGYTFEEWGAE